METKWNNLIPAEKKDQFGKFQSDIVKFEIELLRLFHHRISPDVLSKSEYPIFNAAEKKLVQIMEVNSYVKRISLREKLEKAKFSSRMALR